MVTKTRVPAHIDTPTTIAILELERLSMRSLQARQNRVSGCQANHPAEYPRTS